MGMLRVAAGVAAVALALSPLSAVAQPAAKRAEVSPRALAARIEARAKATSFAELEAWGEAAWRSPSSRERLNRLHHVAYVLENQSEFDRFERWNARLASEAAKAHDTRFSAVARLDALKARYDRGDGSVEPEILRMAQSEPDWFVRVTAMRNEALMLIDRGEIGAALKLVTEADGLIPGDDLYGRSAHADLWEATGLALRSIYDLEGSTQAFARAAFDYDDPAYPRPDFDAVYNLAALAVKLGDTDLARDLYAAHHRLAERADLPHLKVWDKQLCASVAEVGDAPKQALACLADLGPDMKGAEFMAPNLLSRRAIVEARLGQVAAAERDLRTLQKLKGSGQFAPSAFASVPMIEAELLRAQGHDAEAFVKLRRYATARAVSDSRRFNAGVRQITAGMESQLETARRNAALQQDVIHWQRRIEWGAGLFVLCAVAVLVWQRRVAGQLKAARSKAETANRAKSEFLANMSHEIRTPLNGVVGVAELLARAELPPREREMAEIVRASAYSLERLLSDVLDLARVEAGQLAVEVAPFNVAELARSVAALSRLRADEKGLALKLEIAPELDSVRQGDAVRVRQILTNLLSNAVKFTEVGSVTLAVEALPGERVRFTVSDTGVGFDPAQKDRLFGRFQQADGSITRRFGGTGLGLAISRELAELMDGTLDCDVEPGMGARFWFEAPMPAAAGPSAPGTAETGAPTAASDGRPLRVLLADDHPTNQTVVRLLLADFGVETTVVENGAEAVAAVEAGVFDVVLMDMQMPVMDGLEATRRIRAREAGSGAARLPILMLTANAMPEHRDAGARAGADGHVAKPITASSLLAALDAVLPPPEDEPVPSVAAE